MSETYEHIGVLAAVVGVYECKSSIGLRAIKHNKCLLYGYRDSK